MFYDVTYILVIIGAIISLIASIRVKTTFKKYDKVRSKKGLTAQDAARQILNDAGIYDVRIDYISGDLTDHYSPNEKVLRLSESVFNSTSVAAIGVAAHECGHAIQHQQNYSLLSLRSVAIPVANFGSKLSWPIVLVGLWLGSANLAEIGVILFLFVVAFQLLTLPIEVNASKRAIAVLEGSGMLDETELKGSRKVLFAAAMTYVAALFTAIMQLIRLIILVKGGGRRRN